MRGKGPYGSFVVRIWRRDAEPSVAVEHIQSGESLRVSSLAVAMAWMSSRAEQVAGEPDELDIRDPSEPR